MNEEVNQNNITCSNTCNNVDYVTIETLLGDTMTYEEYINSLNKRNLVSADRLQNNWNELKKWLEECLNEIKQNDVYDRTSYEQGQIIALESSIAKMQELEQGKDG